MTKEEFYKAFITIHKDTGKGSPDIIIKMGGQKIKEYLDEFIEEGLCVKNSFSNSFNKIDYYTPTNCYNVWDEENTIDKLICIEYYLNTFEDDPFLKITKEDFDENGKLYDFYQNWINKNKEDLEKIKLLNDNYDEVINSKNI